MLRPNLTSQLSEMPQGFAVGSSNTGPSGEADLTRKEWCTAWI